jgi:hypothetical protein
LTPEAGAKRLLQEAFQLLRGVETEGLAGKIQVAWTAVFASRLAPTGDRPWQHDTDQKCGSEPAREEAGTTNDFLEKHNADQQIERESPLTYQFC